MSSHLKQPQDIGHHDGHWASWRPYYTHHALRLAYDRLFTVWSSGCQTCLSEWGPGQMSETALERKCPWNTYRGSGPLAWCWAAVLGRCWSGPVRTAWPSNRWIPFSFFISPHGIPAWPWHGLGKGPPRWCPLGFWWNVGASAGELTNMGLATPTESTGGVAMW